MAASVSGKVFLPKFHRVQANETEVIPENLNCEDINGCHECVLAGCSPVTSEDRHFEHCAIPGSDERKYRLDQRPSYEELFVRAKKCKDEKKICRVEQTDGNKTGLENFEIGWIKTR